MFPIKSDAQRFELSGPPGSTTAACGVGLYRDDLLGTEFQGNAFTCETVNLVIHRRILKPNGATFTGLRAPDEAGSEFLASADNWFRPVQATTGPDGGLWFADMYRYLIEHPMWIPPADLAKIDQRAGAGLGRIYRVRPEGKPLRPWLRLDKLDAAGLVAALDTPNGWQRDMATQLLLWRNDASAAGPLEKLFQTSSRGVTRLHALTALDGLGKLKKETVAAALGDADPGVRRHALRLAEPHLTDAGIAAKVLKLADDPDAQVRLQAAYTLGEWRDPRAAEALAALARRSARDPFTMSAVMSSLNADNLPALAALVTDRKSGGGPPQQLVRDLLATAAGMDGGKALPKLLEVVVKPDGNVYRPWQLAAAAGALDSLQRQGKGWEQTAGRHPRRARAGDRVRPRYRREGRRQRGLYPGRHPAPGPRSFRAHRRRPAPRRRCSPRPGRRGAVARRWRRWRGPPTRRCRRPCSPPGRRPARLRRLHRRHLVQPHGLAARVDRRAGVRQGPGRADRRTRCGSGWSTTPTRPSAFGRRSYSPAAPTPTARRSSPTTSPR